MPIRVSLAEVKAERGVHVQSVLDYNIPTCTFIPKD